MAGRSPEMCVASDQRYVQRFSQGDEGGIVSGKSVTQFPDSVGQVDMRVADQGELLKIGPRVGSPLFAQLAASVQTPQRVKNLDVDEMRSVEIAVLGDALDQPWR